MRRPPRSTLFPYPALSRSRPFAQEVRFTRPAGRDFWARLVSAPRETADGLIWEGLQIDVTDRVRLYEAAQREITERTRAQEHLQLLINELNHQIGRASCRERV